MRIGIDMLAVQSPGSRLRGIGRYGHNFVKALLACAAEHDFILYAHDGFPHDQIPAAANARVVPIRRDPARGEHTLAALMERISRTNPDHLDLLLVLSPFEMVENYSPPPKPLNGLRMAAIIYDLIPFLFQEQYLHDPYWSSLFYAHLSIINSYDVILAISEATRADCLSLLALSDERVTNIFGATEAGFFEPDDAVPMPLASRRVLSGLGIHQPFVLNVGSMDPRKNLWGLIDAFRLLPAFLRHSHQLVVTFHLGDADRDRVRSYARARGVSEQLVLTGAVSDEALRVLYQRCAAFVHPSLYEGLGLPLLEAMQCGAAVVGGNNSSQIEVIGDAGLLASAHDPADIAAKLEKVLSDRSFAAELGRRARARAQQFTWEATATRAWNALRSAVEGQAPRRRFRADASHAPRPRLAVFAPLPPKGSGIADYTAKLVTKLKPSYAIDLYHDAGYVPDLGLDSAAFGCHDYRLFDRRAAVVPYNGLLYQMGNSLYHKFIYETLMRHPGIVTLHDFCLAGFHEWYGHQPGVAPGHFAREIEHCHPERAREVLARLSELFDDPRGINMACACRGLYLNRRIFEHARRVIVHSQWSLRQIQQLLPEFVDRAVLIPMGATPSLTSAEHRTAVRERFYLKPDALVLASFGILHPNKMNEETLVAFEPLARAYPNAVLLFAGRDWGLGAAQRKADGLGIADRVRFLGRLSTADFHDLMAVTDIAISLRRPPTGGETSAALLDQLASGVPTIVTDVGTFSDYPDTVVRKVPWESEGLDGLRRALFDLAGNRRERERLGRAAADYVREHHRWSETAALYEAVIEQCQAERGPGRAERVAIARGPHGRAASGSPRPGGGWSRR